MIGLRDVASGHRVPCEARPLQPDIQLSPWPRGDFAPDRQAREIPVLHTPLQGLRTHRNQTFSFSLSNDFNDAFLPIDITDMSTAACPYEATRHHGTPLLVPVNVRPAGKSVRCTSSRVRPNMASVSRSLSWVMNHSGN